jgi:protease IV
VLHKSWLVGAFAFVALAGPVQPVRAAANASVTVAHIKLHGDMDEAPVAVDPIFNLGGENFRTKLERIKKAKDSKDIQALYLQFDSMTIGWAKVNELRKAIADFRSSGKKVFAYLESGDAKDYLVACACDEVCLAESGWLMLTGMRMETMFFKDMLDHIGAKADVIKIGDYKGAVEPFTRTSMSKEVRQNYESLLDDMYDHDYVATVVKSRAAKKFTAEQVKKLIDGAPYAPKKALELGLVDRVAYAEDFREAMKKTLDADKLVVKRNYGKAKGEDLDFSNPFLALLKILKPPQTENSPNPKVAVIYAVGPIMSGKGGESMFGGNVVGSTTMIEAIRTAENDKTVKCIVLRIDSPGGSALASDLIWAELKRCKKPVVVSMGDVAASGGYYIAMSAAKIYADPGTLTGSIGVFSMKLVLGGTEDKIGIKTEVLSRGSNAGLFSSSTPFSASERRAFTAVTEDIYDQFLSKALEGRKKAGKNMTREQLEKLAGGRVYSGRQAKEVGLVDELGTLDNAIAAAKDLAGFKGETEILTLPKAKNFLDMLLEKNTVDERLSLTPALVTAFLREMPELGRKLRGVEMYLRQSGPTVWAVSPYLVEVK